MKKLLLLVLAAGLSFSTSALAATQNSDMADVLMAIGEQTETHNISTRPRPPRPPHIAEAQPDSKSTSV